MFQMCSEYIFYLELINNFVMIIVDEFIVYLFVGIDFQQLNSGLSSVNVIIVSGGQNLVFLVFNWQMNVILIIDMQVMIFDCQFVNFVV